MDAKEAIDLGIVAFAGGLVGAGEILNRFRDEPFQALRTWPAVAYVLLNAAAGIVALLLIWAFELRFGTDPSEETMRWTRVILAGFSAVLILRSSLFVRADDDGPWGPGAVFDRIMQATMRSIEHARGEARHAEASEALAGFSYAQVRDQVVPLCLAMHNRASDDEQNELSQAVEDAGESDLPDHLKAVLVGHALITFSNERVLRRAARDAIKDRSVPAV